VIARVAQYQPWRLAHIRRDIAGIVVQRYACRAAFFGDTKLVSVDGVNGIVENRAAYNVTIVDPCVSPSIVPKTARSSLRLRLRNSLCNLGRHESPLHYTSYRTQVPGSELHGGIHAVD